MSRGSTVYALASDRFFLRTATLVLSTYLLEGPLRLALVVLHAQPFLYLRDLATVVLVVLACVSGGAASVPVLVIGAILLAHFLIGCVSLPALLQPLFGFKVFLPLMLGVVLAPLVRRSSHRVGLFSCIAFATTIIGVGINVFVDYPWVGLAYDAPLATTVEVSRLWWTDGAFRLPGFARASFTAAAIVLATLVPTLTIVRRLWIRMLLLAVAGGTVLLTTTKGAMIALVVFVLCEAVHYIGGLQAWISIVAVLATVCLSLPLLGSGLGLHSAHVPSWQLSFVERIDDMWPRAFKLLDEPLQALWGRGLGGIGMAQTLVEPAKFNAGDNVMVYLLISFGVVGIGYVAVMLLRTYQYLDSRSASGATEPLVRGWVVIWLSFGFTTNMIEDTSMALVIGVVLGLVLPGRRKEAITQQPDSDRSALSCSTFGAASRSERWFHVRRQWARATTDTDAASATPRDR